MPEGRTGIEMVSNSARGVGGYPQYAIATRLDRAAVRALIAEAGPGGGRGGRTAAVEVPEGFRVRLLGRLTFTLAIEGAGSGTVVRSRVDHGRFRRRRLLGLVPYGAPRLQGARTYEAGCRRLADAVRRVDPGARVERTVVDVPI